MNLNFPLVTLGDKPIKNQDGEDSVAGKELAIRLFQSNIPDPIKWNEIARKLYAGEEISLDKSDMEKLKSFIMTSTLINGVKEQLINAIV